MSLRPENILALNSGLIPTQQPLSGAATPIFLHLEDLPVDPAQLAEKGISFALVDHNSLLPPFQSSDPSIHAEDPVVAIIDHHADDGNHIHASPRLIQIPTGSTTSLVTTYFQDAWQRAIHSGDEATVPPSELATLLLSGILIDTGALKAGLDVKTTDTDRKAAEFLYRISELGSGSSTSNGYSAPGAVMTLESLRAGRVAPELTEFANKLFEAKNDVSELSTHELLLRDYKEYTMHTSSESDALNVGLSTVPMGLSIWLSRNLPAKGITPGWQPFVSAMDEWMDERNLDIAGILTSFNNPPKEIGEKGKHKRELVFIVRARQPVSGHSITRAEEIADALTAGINGAGPILDAQVWRPHKPFHKDEELVQGLEDELMNVQEARQVGRFGCVWRQGNAASTRKQVAPLVVSYCLALLWQMLLLTVNNVLKTGP
jgi:exopolyphosphatase